MPPKQKAEGRGEISPASEIDDDIKVAVMDRAIQEWAKQAAKMADDAVGDMPKRTADQPGFDCEVEQAAVKISLQLKAVHFGTLKVLFKVLPRQIEIFLVDQIEKVIGKIGVKVIAKKLISNFPGIDLLVKVGVGSVTAISYMAKLEQMIHDVLGCQASKLEAEPMRLQFNELVQAIKDRTAGKARVPGPVATRN